MITFPIKNIISTILFFLLILSNTSAQIQEYIQSNYYTENIIVNKDTLIQATIVKSIKSEFYESEIQATFLFKKEKNQIDTLLTITPYIEDFELHHDFINPPEFDLSPIISDLKYGKYNVNEIDSTRYQYWAITDLKHIKDGVFQIIYSNSSYTGGAHGYGVQHFAYYDYLTNKKFNFEDVFTSKAWNIIFREFLKEMHIDESETNFEDLPSDYLFTLDSIDFECGMYGTIFGYGGNYLGCHFSVPYAKLKKHMIKDSPIWRIKN